MKTPAPGHVWAAASLQNHLSPSSTMAQFHDGVAANQKSL
jgi:hypothetical protein